jgi:hypothetical protein
VPRQLASAALVLRRAFQDLPEAVERLAVSLVLGGYNWAELGIRGDFVQFKRHDRREDVPIT